MALSLACKALPGTRGAGHLRHWEREEHHRLTRFYAISTLLKWYRASRPAPPVAHRQRGGNDAGMGRPGASHPNPERERRQPSCARRDYSASSVPARWRALGMVLPG